jgi:DNA-binding response OmpR family regulator
MDRTRLLIIDRNETFNALMKKSLERTGRFEVISATDRDTGIELFSGYRPDIVLSNPDSAMLDDVNMISRTARAVIQHIKNPPGLENDTFSIGKFAFSISKQQLQKGDTTVKLTARETKIIEMLRSRIGEVVPREDILRTLWGISDYYSSRSLDVFVHGLRRRFSADPRIEINVIRNRGLQLAIRRS